MICKNCGAQFQDSLPKCPYCETLHYAGARKEYMEKLEDMKDDLSELHEVVPELYNEQLRTQTENIKKTIFRVFIVLGILFLFFFISRFVFDSIGSHDQKQALLFSKEAYPIADEFYETGDYEGLLEFYQTSITENESADFYSWAHYPFLMCYENAIFFREAAKRLQTNEFDEFDVSEIFYCYISNRYYQKEYPMDETDQQLVSSYEAEMETVIDELQLTDKELEELNKLLNDTDYPSWDDIQNFSKKIYKRIR